MKRSRINRLIEDALDFTGSLGFHLPPFARWSAEQWRSTGHEADEIREHRLGWDVTDFARGDFDRFGLVLFTLRNGHPAAADTAKKYCEKIMVVRQGQTTPMHFHHAKMEDIINRGGGVLVCKVYQAAGDETLSDGPVLVSLDGVVREVPPGTEIDLHPGESITLPPRLYHAFWSRPGTGQVLAGEVSTVNDDETDNRFHEPLARFATIEEDEPARFLLCNEYPPGAP